MQHRLLPWLGCQPMLLTSDAWILIIEKFALSRKWR